MSDYICIKGKFHAPKEGYYGLFFILINTSTEYLDTASVVVALSQESHNISIKKNWHDFDQKISKIKYDGGFSQSITMGFQEILTQLADDNQAFSKIYTEIKQNNLSGLKNSFSILFNKVLHQEQLEIELGLEHLSKEDLDINSDVKEKIQEPIDNQSSEEGIEGVFIESNLVIDPTKGKKIGDIRSGELIMIKISPSSDRANYFIDLFQLRTEENKILPKEVLLTKKIEVEKGMELICKIDEGVFSKIFIESNNLLVATPQEKTPVVKTNNKQKQVSKSSSNQKTNIKIYILGSIIFILVILAAIFILND